MGTAESIVFCVEENFPVHPRLWPNEKHH